MFGVGDNNQNSNGSALPPSPFTSSQPLADPAAAVMPTPEPLTAPMPATMPEPVVASPDPTSVHDPMPAPVHSAVANEDQLVGIKQDALNNLMPLVNHLDQTPEEKFKTTMMLIQASDNPNLVKEAYNAANQIHDEKVRAQALLDVVNEINYFTQKDLPEDHKD